MSSSDLDCASPEPGEEPEPNGERADAGEANDATNAVSLLQEFVQSCSSFSPHTKILTWAFEQRLEGESLLQFRATVSFLFGNVPHYFCGGWQTSKKKAQRDTAERVRRYLQQRCCEGNSSVDPSTLPESVAQELWAICQGRGTTLPIQLEQQAHDDGSLQFRATLTFNVHSVPHHFAGGWCESESKAEQDTAERMLWFFGRRSEGFVAPGEVVLPQESLAELRLPAPKGEPVVVADKTILMQVQNALQKMFAKDTPPGERVWVWNYEPDSQDPQLFRASVEVPCWGQSFVGDWCRGKKLAQRNACLAVKKHLDQLLAAG